MDNPDNQIENQHRDDLINNYQEMITTASNKKWSMKRMALIIIGVIITFIVALTVIVNISTTAPLRLSDELIANIQANKATAAYNLLSDDVKPTIDTGDFATIIEQLSSTLTGDPEVKTKEIGNGSSASNSAKIVYKITGSDNSTYNFTVNLTEKNNNWKVLNFEKIKEQ